MVDLAADIALPNVVMIEGAELWAGWGFGTYCVLSAFEEAVWEVLDGVLLLERGSSLTLTGAKAGKGWGMVPQGLQHEA